MDSLTQRLLISARSVRPAAKSIPKEMNRQLEITKQNEKITDNIWKVSESQSPSSKLSVKEKYRDHARHHHAKAEEALKKSKKSRRTQKINH